MMSTFNKQASFLCCATTRPKARLTHSERLTDWIQVYGAISLGRFKDTTVWNCVYQACVPQGFPARPPAPQFGSAYAFVNKCPVKPQSNDWDADETLRITLALSRLIHPTSTGLEYAARVRFADDGSVKGVIPARIHGLGAYAFVSPSQESRNRLMRKDAVSLAALCGAFHSESRVLPDRIRRALWIYEYASWTNDAGIRWALIVTGLEALLNTGADRISAQFKTRIVNLAKMLQLDMTRTKADQAYGLRSGILHGRAIRDLAGKDLELYDKLDELLRGSVMKAIVDEAFRTIFESDNRIVSAFGAV